MGMYLFLHKSKSTYKLWENLLHLPILQTQFVGNLKLSKKVQNTNSFYWNSFKLCIYYFSTYFSHQPPLVMKFICGSAKIRGFPRHHWLSNIEWVIAMQISFTTIILSFTETRFSPYTYAIRISILGRVHVSQFLCP